MNVLIVEDKATKANALQSYLIKEFDFIRNLDVCGTAHDARNLLESSHYDALILDILIPRRKSEEPAIDCSVELVEELAETEFLKQPKFIIGLTAYADVAASVRPVFADHLWTVIHFDEISDSWQRPIFHCLQYLRRLETNEGQQDKPVDVCILTALQQPEMTALIELPWDWDSPKPIDECTFVREGSFQSEGKTFSVLASVAPKMGMVPMSTLASKLIIRFKPRIIALCGICAGVRSRVNLGDVVCANPTWDWQSGKLEPDGSGGTVLSISPDHIAPEEVIVARMEIIRQDNQLFSEIKNDWPDPPRSDLKLFVEPMVSGSAVVSDESIVEKILEQHRDTHAIEMEAYGLATAERYCGRGNTIAFTLKGICDFADQKKDDKMRSYAAHNSARIVAAFLERYMHELT